MKALRALPGGKLPDRRNFKTWGDDEAGRQAAWRGAHAQAQRLAEAFAEWFARASRPGQGVEIRPLPRARAATMRVIRLTQQGQGKARRL